LILDTQKDLKQKIGENGSGNHCYGKSGEDLYIKVPSGTVLKDAETGKVILDISKIGQKELVLKGGMGGKGNSHFATSTRQAPHFAIDGEKGKEKEIILELKLLADVRTYWVSKCREINYSFKSNSSNT
jgi:GTP-binding protein